MAQLMPRSVDRKKPPTSPEAKSRVSFSKRSLKFDEGSPVVMELQDVPSFVERNTAAGFRPTERNPSQPKP